MTEVERFLVRNGLPQLVPGWGVRSHVVPRMLPALAFYTGGVLTLPAVTDDVSLVLWPSIGGVIAAVAAWAVCLPYRAHKRVFSRGTVAVLLALYLVLPVAVVLLDYDASGWAQVAGELELDPVEAAVFSAVALEVIAIGWLVCCRVGVSLGVVALLRIGARQSRHDLANSTKLHGRALPTMLFVTLLAFFSAEMWQLSDRLTWRRMILVLLLFAAVTIAASASHLRDELDRIEDVTLTPGQERNVLAVLATRQLVQATVVGLSVFVFFIALGTIAVDPITAKTWVGSVPKPSLVPGVSGALLRCATLLAGFGAMNFAVSTMTDPTAKQEFFRPILDELEDVLHRFAKVRQADR
ncbi:MAG: hypothetical protein HOY71_55835 [Nonomuraea sp.]|nr:hypothetical protein [Nonomuraea sp.]